LSDCASAYELLMDNVDKLATAKSEILAKIEADELALSNVG